MGVVILQNLSLFCVLFSRHLEIAKGLFSHFICDSFTICRQIFRATAGNKITIYNYFLVCPLCTCIRHVIFNPWCTSYFSTFQNICRNKYPTSMTNLRNCFICFVHFLNEADKTIAQICHAGLFYLLCPFPERIGSLPDSGEVYPVPNHLPLKLRHSFWNYCQQKHNPFWQVRHFFHHKRCLLLVQPSLLEPLLHANDIQANN